MKLDWIIYKSQELQEAILYQPDKPVCWCDFHMCFQMLLLDLKEGQHDLTFVLAKLEKELNKYANHNVMM